MTELRDLTLYEGVIFDLDGVLTPTADVHERAWGNLFRDYFTEHGITPEYNQDDYYTHLDGKPRYDAVSSLLSARGVSLPYGATTDSVDADTICGLGNRKNVVFSQILETEGVAPYPGSLALVHWLIAHDIRVAVASSSRNAVPVLTAAGIADLFETVVDGLVAAEEGLTGKPAPDIFLRAAEKESISPANSIVVEDAISGVTAGAAGGFTVVGVDRGVGEDALRAAGAHVVVSDLAQLIPPTDPSAASSADASTSSPASATGDAA